MFSEYRSRISAGRIGIVGGEGLDGLTFMEFEPFLERLVPFETKVKERDEFVSVRGLSSRLRVRAACGFAHASERCPDVGTGKHTLEEVAAAIGIAQRSFPPTEPWWITLSFGCPSYRELKSEDFIEGVGRNRGGHVVLQWSLSVWGENVTDHAGEGEENFARADFGEVGLDSEVANRQRSPMWHGFLPDVQFFLMLVEFDEAIT